MLGSESVFSNRCEMTLAAVTLVRLEPVVGILPGEPHHVGVPVHLRENRCRSDRDAVAVRFDPGDHGKWMGKLWSDVVDGAIEEHNRAPHRHTSTRKIQKSPGDRSTERYLDALVVDFAGASDSDTVVRECLAQFGSHERSLLLTHRFRVANLVWPRTNSRLPHHDSRHNRPRDRTPPYFVAPDNETVSLLVERLLDSQCGKGAGSHGSRDSMPTNVSG